MVSKAVAHQIYTDTQGAWFNSQNSKYLLVAISTITLIGTLVSAGLVFSSVSYAAFSISAGIALTGIVVAGTVILLWKKQRVPIENVSIENVSVEALALIHSYLDTDSQGRAIQVSKNFMNGHLKLTTWSIYKDAGKVEQFIQYCINKIPHLKNFQKIVSLKKQASKCNFSGQTNAESTNLVSEIAFDFIEEFKTLYKDKKLSEADLKNISDPTNNPEWLVSYLKNLNNNIEYCSDSHFQCESS